jgi:Peptidase A4 family
LTNHSRPRFYPRREGGTAGIICGQYAMERIRPAPRSLRWSQSNFLHFAVAIALAGTPAAGMLFALGETTGFSAPDIKSLPQPVRKISALQRPAHNVPPLLRSRHEDIGANWAGYVLPGGVNGGTYTAAQGTWIVPKVSWVNYSAQPHHATIIEDSSAWIGIGGFGETVLIQLGTDHGVTHDDSTQQDTASYYAWYELYPANPVILTATRFAIQPGDTITASLQCTASCAPGGQSTWIMSLNDVTRWKTPFTIQVQNSHTVLATAEWILEDNGVYDLTLASTSYLPNYQQVTFTDITANGANPNLSRAQHAAMVVDPQGKSWSAVSDPAGGNSFSVSFVPPLSP